MRLGLQLVSFAGALLLALSATPAIPCQSRAQAPSAPPVESPRAPLPGAFSADSAFTAPQNSASGQNPPAQPAPAQPIPESPGQERRRKAQEQIREQEKQRVLGVVPMFNTSYRRDAVSLTASQKMNLAFHSAIDPVTFAGAAMVAGFAEISPEKNNSGFGWGAAGYGKRWGAAYLDSFDGTMLGNGILPSIFHQDPRYFRLGRGSTAHRVLYSVGSAFICPDDKTRRWEPNYSNIGGNLAAGYISNLYYPSQAKSGWAQALTSGFVVTATGTAGNVFQEFWPDISRKLFHKDPTHGLDAQMRVADAQARQAQKAKQPLPPSPK